jgi:hypothetical protein
VLCAAAFVSHMICQSSQAELFATSRGVDGRPVLVANYSFRDKVSYEDAVQSLQDHSRQCTTSDFRGQLRSQFGSALAAAMNEV